MQKDILYSQIQSAHSLLWNSLKDFELEQNFELDIFKTGLLGIEDSPITTKHGNLRAKQISTNPAWCEKFYNWFSEANEKTSDNVSI